MNPTDPPPLAVVLSSGGLDSTTTLAMARAKGFRLLAVTFRYGQRHELEVEAARKVAKNLEVEEHLELDLPLGFLGGSSLLGDGEIPKSREGEAPVGSEDAIPSTYVPARNLIFLSLAVAVAESRGSRDLYIGANAVDYSGYPDCRPAFLDAFCWTANLGTKEGVNHGGSWFRIHAPLTELTKAEIIRRGTELGVDYAITHSCYDPAPSGAACGHCDSCVLRRRGFEEAEIPDPTRYA